MVQDTTKLVQKYPHQISDVPDRVHLKDSILIHDTIVHTIINSADTTIKTERPRRVSSPQRATILSAVFPGLGQAYNHKYWKIPIFYVTGASLVYIYDFQNDHYLRYKQKYEEEVSKGANAEQRTIEKYTNEFEIARKRRDYCVIFMGVLYLANIVDAMADSYFFQYDISDDLTVQIKPSVMPEPFLTSANFSYGIQIHLHF